MGHNDYYVAAVKGTILSQLSDAKIVDITHQIPPFDIFKTAFILKNCYKNFPKGSIHIIGVNPEISVDTPHLVVKHNEHFFIGADNGIFSLLFDEIPTDVYEINIKQDTDDLTFPVKDIFTKVACHLARGGTPELVSRRKESVRQVITYQPVFDDKSIRGSVIYIDGYGNLITNITQAMFKNVGRGRAFSIHSRRIQIFELSKKYGDVSEGDPLALFTSSGYLEIAMNRAVEGAGGGAS
jgi:hypothetical protein